MSEPKTCSGSQSHNHHAVFNVTARLESVIPEIKRLRNMAAETNQQKQKRTGLKKLSSHFTVLGCRKFRVRSSAHDLVILGVLGEDNLKACISAGHPAPPANTALTKRTLRHEDDSTAARAQRLTARSQNSAATTWWNLE
jgi:hypothetical protein